MVLKVASIKHRQGRCVCVGVCVFFFIHVVKGIICVTDLLELLTGLINLLNWFNPNLNHSKIYTVSYSKNNLHQPPPSFPRVEVSGLK